MTGWWVHDLYQAGLVVELLSWIFWVIFSITMHELAHGWAALWQGDDTPRRLGRMTVNPLVHMGMWSFVALALLGIAWGLMPVDPSRFRWGRRGRVVVSGAGPAMNFVLAIATVLLLVGWLAVGTQGTAVYRNVTVFLWTGAWLNIVLGLFNLLPVPPLDGSSILSGLSFRIWQLYQHPNAQLFGMALVLIVIFTGCFGFVFAWTRVLTDLVVDVPGRLLGNPMVRGVMAG